MEFADVVRELSPGQRAKFLAEANKLRAAQIKDAG